MPKQTQLPSYKQLEAEMDNETLFYQVPKEMALKAIHARLTAADWALWTYLQVFDPHGDRMKLLPEISKIAQTIGVSERQVQRSLAKLSKLGFYHWEPVVIKGQNLAGKKVKELSKQRKTSIPFEESKMTTLSESRQLCPKDDNFVEAQTTLSESRQLCPNQLPKPLPDKASTSPHTIQTYTDYTNSLSDSEREKFEKYVREEWKKLTAKNGEPGEEIVSFERFLSKEEDRKNWWDRFVNSSAGRAAKIESEAKQYDWENDPRFMDWLHKAYCEGYPWTQEDEAEREQRTAFLWWAQRTNAYAGRIEHESA